MTPIPDIEHSQALRQNATSSAHLRLKESADVEVYINPAGAGQPVSENTKITTTATECSWNVYATAKLPKPDQVSNRAQLVDTTSNGQIVRVGNAIFLPQPDSSLPAVKPFILTKFSLYIDSIEQQGQRLFVTSRQDITTIPEPKDEPANNADAESKDDKSKDDESKDEKADAEDVKKITESTEKSPTTPADPATKDKDGERKEDDSSDDENASDKLPESEDSSNELSADESWSEGSTEYDSDQQIPEFRPIMPPLERLQPASDSDSSSDIEEEPETSASEASDDETNLVEEEDKDEHGRYMDSDEESERYDAMFVTDRVDPASDVDDQSSEAGYQEDDMPDWQDWGDGDGFKAGGSDSEECSECGDDGGACALPPKDDVLPPSTVDKDAEEPVGCPVAQINIYDLSRKTATTTDTGESNLEPTRIFHFKRTTEQTLAKSPLAIHPTKPLLVWPLGDNKILFADYLSNTYFVRKFQTSQFWSVHVSINCHFSENGNYLHVVAVEKSGKPPALPVRVKKGKRKTDSKKDKDKDAQKSKEEKPRYEMIVSTYRMSQSKTTKVPPVLIGRVQKNLGELNILPTVSWSGTNVYISLSKKSTCHIYRVDLGYPSAGKSKRSKQGRMTMQSLTAGIPEWAVGRDVQFVPSDGRTGEGQLLITAEMSKIPSYRPVAPKESDKTPISETETSEDTSTINETSSKVSIKTITKSETNGTVTNGDDTEANISHVDGAKTSESQSPDQPTQDGPEQVDGVADTAIDMRPEKCPIISCEYNKKGFTRKYDRNRHTLLHYKGTIVCDFCPDSGSAEEKTFNRVDVLKRHLTTVHGVEQTPPSSSKSNVEPSSHCESTTGKCSICTATFDNVQEFYEHLDDCVLKVVQQEDAPETVEASVSTLDASMSATTDSSSPNPTEQASQPTTTDKGTETSSSSESASPSTPTNSEPKPNSKPTPNPHPNTMTTHLSSKLIKSLGGWRDTSCIVDEDAMDTVNGQEKCCGVGAGKSIDVDEEGDVATAVLEFESI